jgi:hypothetical protein
LYPLQAFPAPSYGNLKELDKEGSDEMATNS